MTIAMRCPGCQTLFEFTDNLAGKRIKCKSCGDIFRVDEPARTRRGGDDDPPRPSRNRRREADEEQDDALRSTGWRRDDHDDDEEFPRRSRQRDGDAEPGPRRRRLHPLVIIGPIAALVILGVVVAYVLSGRGKKGPGVVDKSDIVKEPSRSCPIEVAEKDAGILVVPDGGTIFGLLRKTDAVKKAWVFEPYDVAAGRRLGKLELTDLDEVRSASLSPNGKYLLVVEGPAFGNVPPTLRVWSVAESRPLAPKWNPYPAPPKAGFDPPQLYRAEFIGNDKILTISTARFMDVWPVPSLGDPVVTGVQFAAKGPQLGQEDRHGKNHFDKFERQVAFSADHRTIAVWNGDGFTFANCADGQELGATPSVQALAKELWGNVPFPDQIKGGPIAFSPDGKVLAGIITQSRAGTQHALCLWDVKEQKMPVRYEIRGNQFNDSPALYWWGNRFVVTHGARTEGMLVDIHTGLGKRQLMAPPHSDSSSESPSRYRFGRDGRLWYVAGDDRTSPAKVNVVEAINTDAFAESDDYEQIAKLGNEFFLRRFWLEPAGVLRKYSRLDPALTERLIRRP